MNQMEIFKNPEFGAIRAVEIDGEPWLVGKDVSLALGYTNPQKAIRDHVDAEDRTVNDSFTVNGTAITLINESGLYSLVLSSKLPKAKQFRRWVTSEVLPTIRKHGAYMTREKLWEVATSPEALLKLCSELLAEREENAVLREENALLEGKAAFFDLFIDMKQSTNLRTTAKELVVPERRFVRFLLEQRFVYRTASGNVLPYADPENEEKMEAAIAELVKGKTLVVIAHKLPAIMNADQICVMDHGKMVATGKHQELIQACPEYQKLWKAAQDSAEWKVSTAKEGR